MSTDPAIAELQKQLQTAITKIASMESELAPLRAQARGPQGPTPQQVIQAMVQNPHGTMGHYGVPKEYQQHMARSLIAAEMQAMGIPVDPMIAAQTAAFPTSQKADTALEQVAALRQELATRDSEAKVRTARESLKTIDKSKYPHLAAMMAKNPGLYDARVTAESDIAALSESIEKELATVATTFGVKTDAAQSASQEDAGNATTTTSTQVTAQPVGTRAGDPPPLPKGNKSTFTEDDDKALRDEIARKYDAGHYGTTSTPR